MCYSIKNLSLSKDFYLKMKKKIYTIQMAKWRNLPDNIELVNITSKEKHFFSPRWEIIEKSKKGEITPEQYEEIYFKDLKQKMKNIDIKSIIFSSKKDLALSCYCNENKFCHRYLAIKFLKQLNLEEIEFCGEYNNKN